MATSNPIFEVPELLQVFLERLENPSDAARLACVCRRLFDSCMPFAWKRVSSTTQLLRLLPGVTISKTKDVEMRDRHIVELPKILVEADLTRFHFYAAFVKILDMFEFVDKPMHWTILNWEWIFLHSRAQPLLPNLHTLTFTNVTEWCQPAHIWLTLFLSPQLSTFESRKISHYPTCFTLPASQFILVAIADMCPRIHTLGFLPAAGGVMNGTFLLPRGMDLRPYHRYNPGPLFSRMEHLTTLRVETEIRTLSRLSSWRRFFTVRWLEVNLESSYFTDDRPLPFDPFPNLRHLGVLNCPYQLMPNLPSSITALTSLQLHFNYFPNDFHEILSKIAEYNPCLLDLSIHPFYDYPFAFNTDGRRWPLLESATLEPLARLTRLEHFCLSDLIIVSPNQDAAEVLSHIGGLLPNLKVLEVPHQVIPMSKLPKVVLHLPRLEFLSVTVTEQTVVGQPEVGPPTSALRILESEFERGFVRAVRKNKLAEDADKTIARYLASLCVNVRILNRPGRDWKCSTEESAAASGVITSINEHLSALAPRGSTPYKSATYPTLQTPWQSLPKELR
ncbi:hypothetical protein FRC09_000488 [Ceratobasidium sp. 395]|nr:hypothetical protein FRC09_000488 [Ceratobasidium sp. 395]